MMTDNLFNRLSAAQFAAHELTLYLDTHPDDVKMAELHKVYVKKVKELEKEYEKSYGPLTCKSGSGKQWTKEPWPWQNMGGMH